MTHEAPPAEAASQHRSARFVDADVHPMVPDMDCLFRYLSKEWQVYCTSRHIDITKGRGGAPDRYARSDASLQPDATPPSGGVPGSNPVFMCEHYLNRYGPERVVLQYYHGEALISWTDPDAVAALYSACNDYFVNEWLPVDNRFTYAILAVTQDPVQAAKEIRRLGSHPGVVAVNLPLSDRLMGERYYYPIYEAALDVGLPMLTHLTGTEGTFHGSPSVGGIPSYRAERRVLFPQVAQSNACSLIFQGVFERFKGLKVVFVEYGFSWLLSLKWRLDDAWKESRREVPWVKRSPSEYIDECMRFTTQPVDEPGDAGHMQTLIDLLGGERVLLFSTDYPHWNTDFPNTTLKELPLEKRERIFYRNAMEFFPRLSVTPAARV